MTETVHKEADKTAQTTGNGALVIAGALALLIGFMLYYFTLAPKEMQLIRTFPEPRALAPFSGTDHQGNPFTTEQLIGQWDIVFFGFTTCPDVCPTAMADLSRLQKDLPQELADSTQFHMISVDPERDTIEKLEQYVPAFNPTFNGIRGTWQDTQALAKSFGVSFFKAPGKPNPDNYLIEHTARWFIIDPLGRRYALVAPDEVADKSMLIETLVDDYSIMRDQANF